MDSENQPQSTSAATGLPSSPATVVTASSIAELLNSSVTLASLNGSSPVSSSSPSSASTSANNMTTIVPHHPSTDVATIPCTSNAGIGQFRSSPFLDSNKSSMLPLTTSQHQHQQQPIGAQPPQQQQQPPPGSNFASSNIIINNNNTAPPLPPPPRSQLGSGPPPPSYHSHFRQDQPVAPLVAVRGKTDPAMAPYVCAKCKKNIVDRYLLEALDKYWHEDCLKCDACDGRLGELGSKLYFKNNSILCQRDYLRIFRPTGTCAACTKTIPAFEQVMRAGANVYHLECFACQECNHRFCIGDKFYLDVDHNKILCEYDYEERMVFAQMAYNYNSLAQLKRQISQQVDDFDEVQPVAPR